MKKFIIVMLTAALLLTACGRLQNQAQAPAGLTPLAADNLSKWAVPAQLQLTGEGNIYRLVTGAGLGAEQALELAAGGNGQLVYYQEAAASPDVRVRLRLQFLSTQGTGQIRVSAFDANHNEVASANWVVTGNVPSGDSMHHWTDVKYNANFKGEWLEQDFSPAELLVEKLPGANLSQAHTYRVSVAVGEGQHALITAFDISNDITKAVKIIPAQTKYAAVLGNELTLDAEVQNVSNHPVQNVAVSAVMPYGYGLELLDSQEQIVPSLAPGARQHVTWHVRAQRPDTVNLGQPWPVAITVNGVKTAAITVAVSDPRPGKIFYVMTEDLEPIDAAGYSTAWGNRNGWLDPQEFMVQIVGKSEALNGIADKYGAKWTHYLAWPAVEAAQWAAAREKGEEWNNTIKAITASVTQEAKRGHEYGIHMHSDYDLRLPGNVLSYNSNVNGLWANHLRHGWAHSVAGDGGFDDYATRTGILYHYQRIIDELSSASQQGQLITARAGSFDFGEGRQDEALSTAAYQRVGLWGSSDADGNAGGITSGEYGREIYLAKPDDINAPADNLAATGVVEFRPTPHDFINYDSQQAAVMNSKVDQGVAAFTGGGIIKPGVHAIVGFTHAMFVMGQGGWQSTEGGQFSEIDKHLAYVKSQYVDRSIMQFATAGELVRAYLDYYTPQPIALYGPRLAESKIVSEYRIDILGRDILFDQNHPHTVSIKYPLYLRDSAFYIAILKDGQPIYSTWGLPTPYNDLQFTVNDSKAKYVMKIYHNKLLYELLRRVRTVQAKILGKK